MSEAYTICISAKTFDDLKNSFANTTYMSKTRHAKCFKYVATGIRWNGICRNNHITPYQYVNIISTFHLFCDKRSKSVLFYYFFWDLFFKANVTGSDNKKSFTQTIL